MSKKFKSKFEQDLYEAAVKNKKKLEYETVYLKYSIPGTYNPDFLLPNGIIVEAKGYFDLRAQVKMRAVKQANPELDIRFVFMNANTKIRKNSKMTYADWCDKYDFPYAEKHIPLAWWKEPKRKISNG